MTPRDSKSPARTATQELASERQKQRSISPPCSQPSSQPTISVLAIHPRHKNMNSTLTLTARCTKEMARMYSHAGGRNKPDTWALSQSTKEDWGPVATGFFAWWGVELWRVACRPQPGVLNPTDGRYSTPPLLRPTTNMRPLGALSAINCMVRSIHPQGSIHQLGAHN